MNSTYSTVPRLRDPPSVGSHALPVTLDERYDVPILVERRPELVLLLARLHDIRDRRDAHLSHCCWLRISMNDFCFVKTKNYSKMPLHAGFFLNVSNPVGEQFLHMKT